MIMSTDASPYQNNTRNRKTKRTVSNSSRNYDEHGGDRRVDHGGVVGGAASWGRRWRLLSDTVGVIVCLMSGGVFSWYMARIHENMKGFSEITEQRRELSFVSESALYYSYYKQMLSASTLSQGLTELVNDQKTEHLKTINILQRFNVYQEVILSVLYRIFNRSIFGVSPAVFYTSSVFVLHSALIWALYCITWLNSGSWLAALLSVLFYAINKDETTRVGLSVPLRESFALPFVWIQVAALNAYLKQSTKGSQRVCLIVMLASSFCLALTWQFTQFVLLLQAMAIFAVAILDIVPLKKVYAIFSIHVTALVAVFFCQFCNMMIMNSLLFSFIPASLIVFKLKFWYSLRWPSHMNHVINYCIMVAVWSISVLTLMFCINALLKLFIRQEDDSHIRKFIMAKAGFDDPRNFDVRMYLCTVAFLPISFDAIVRMTIRVVLPLYVIFTTLTVSSLIIGKFRQIKRMTEKEKTKENCVQFSKAEENEVYKKPHLVYNTIQHLLFGILAVSTARFKYLWGPYVCIMASLAVSDGGWWAWLISKCCQSRSRTVFLVRHCCTLAVIVLIISINADTFRQEMKMSKRFDDPHTRELTDWISKHTDENAAFCGSMVTMATVKLSTRRPIVNHPHYEDKELRMRTKKLYQVYGRKSAKSVHRTMTRYDVSYVVIDERLCLSEPYMACMPPHIMDVVNGHIPDSGQGKYKGLKMSRVPRFCIEVHFGRGNHGRLFKEVFINDFYRVYKVIM